jgi:hypothetical protein
MISSLRKRISITGLVKSLTVAFRCIKGAFTWGFHEIYHGKMVTYHGKMVIYHGKWELSRIQKFQTGI